MSDPVAREFTWIEGLAFCLAYIGIQLSSEVLNQWGTYFYSPSEGTGRTVYVAIGAVGYFFIVGTLWDAITDPLVGVWSDRTPIKPGKWRLPRITGRRRPFIFWGSFAMVIPAIAFWYPPVEGTSSVNFYYGTFMICLHWTLFTVTTIPIVALGPEVARSARARVRLGIWIAIGFIVGLALANALTGVLIKLLDSAHEGTVTSAAGYRRVAIFYAFLSFALFQVPVWLVKERYEGRGPAIPFRDAFKGFGDAVRNVPFVLYFVTFFLFTTGFLATQRALPYWAELGLGGDESTVTALLGPFILTALVSYLFVPALARRLGTKWMIFLALLIITTGLPLTLPIGLLEASSGTKILLGALLFGYCGIGQGILYVMMTPMLGEIIDFDEQRSGQRREALYNGLSGVAWKASMAGSIFIATQSMNLWGNSREDPLGVYLVGPIAGCCGLLGLVALWFYPVLQVTREPETGN